MKTAAGTKFGKTEAGTVWLDPARTSERDFYQFWLQHRRSRRHQLLKVFTWLDERRSTARARRLQDDPSARAAQRRLADEVTRGVHGEGALTEVQSDAALRFGGAVSAAALQQVAPSASVSLAKIKAGLPNTELVTIAGLAKSKSEAFRLIEQGGITVNDVTVTDPRGACERSAGVGQSLQSLKRAPECGGCRDSFLSGLTSTGRSPTLGRHDSRDVLGLERRAAREVSSSFSP